MRIVEATPLAGFRLQLRFDNGAEGLVDLSSFSGKGVFAAWMHPGSFDQVRITDIGAVEWPGEIDLCPDALYLQMTGRSPEDHFPHLRRGLAHA